MKKIIIALFVLSSTNIYSKSAVKPKEAKKTKVDQQIGSPFTIKGKMEGYKLNKVMIAPFLNQAKMDTLNVVDGEFKYSGKLVEPTAFIYLREDGQSNVFFLDPGNHDMIIDCIENKGFGMTNSPSQESYNLFGTTVNPLVEQRAKFGNANDEATASLRNDNEMNIQNIFKAYIQDSNSAPLPTAFLVYNSLFNMTAAGEKAMMELYNLQSEKAKQSELGKKSLAMIARMSADDMGKIAPDFTLLDSAGKKITLSQFRNKNYVLVDFWATWCGPCRAEFPALKVAQEKYKSKGLVILGVSIDADKTKWKNMLAQPGFTNWQHVWDGPQGPNQIVATIYNVPSIPRNFLLDKTGKVIARNLRGADVEKTLESFIK